MVIAEWAKIKLGSKNIFEDFTFLKDLKAKIAIGSSVQPKIILGCTELPIAIFAFKSFKNIKSSKVFLDPNLILAHSAMVKHNK